MNCTGLMLAGICKLMIRQELLVEVDRPLLPTEVAIIRAQRSEIRGRMTRVED